MPAPLPDFSLAPGESTNSELTRKLLDYLLSGDLTPGQKLLIGSSYLRWA
jgi:hypothetical protein